MQKSKPNKSFFFLSNLLWNYPLYAMFYFPWLIKKLLLPIAGQNITGQGIQAEIEEGRRQSLHVAARKQEVKNH